MVHGCLEGPEAGVYYRGKGEIPEGEDSVVITLPNIGGLVSLALIHRDRARVRHPHRQLDARQLEPRLDLAQQRAAL